LRVEDAYLDRVTSHADGILVQRGIAYGHGQALDVHTPLDTAEAPIVLLWHGVGANERELLEPLARVTAALGVTPPGA
jgi:predicted esterase